MAGSYGVGHEGLPRDCSFSRGRTIRIDQSGSSGLDKRSVELSVPSNIAEGAARGSRKEFIHFLTISRGSLSELDTQLRIAVNLEYVMDIDSLIMDVERLQAALGALIKSQRDRLAE